MRRSMLNLILAALVVCGGALPAPIHAGQFGVLGRGVARAPVTLTNVWVATGDSITACNHVSAGQCYTDYVSAAFPAVATNLHNIGVPSSYIDSAGQGASADALYDGTKQVDVVSILFGANDMYSGSQNESASTFVNNLKTFGQARQAAGFKTLVLTVLPSTNDAGAYNVRRNAANVLIRALVHADGVDAIADVGGDATFGTDAAASNVTYYSDGVHPTALTNSLMEPYVTAALRTLVQR
jgi:lysophospholipase L1-like esterase